MRDIWSNFTGKHSEVLNDTIRKKSDGVRDSVTRFSTLGFFFINQPTLGPDSRVKAVSHMASNSPRNSRNLFQWERGSGVVSQNFLTFCNTKFCKISRNKTIISRNTKYVPISRNFVDHPTLASQGAILWNLWSLNVLIPYQMALMKPYGS
jgi:hypothetical protein